MKKYLGNKFAIILFVAPTLIIYSLVMIYPILQSSVMSFFNWDGLTVHGFVGLDNYIRMFKSPELKIALQNAVIYSGVITVYILVIASALALILNSEKLRGSKFFRTSFFIPVVLSTTVVAQLWLAIYHTDFGLLNHLFKLLGLEYRQSWLFDPETSIFAIAMTDAWKGVGYYMIIIYAGLRSLPAHYFEAAKVDGANSIQTLRKITLPLMLNNYKIIIVMTLTFGIRAFENIWIMTRGGPGNATNTMTIMLYKAIINLNSYGYGAAIAVVLIIECIIVMVVINKVFGLKRFQY